MWVFFLYKNCGILCVQMSGGENIFQIPVECKTVNCLDIQVYISFSYSNPYSIYSVELQFIYC